MGSLSLEPIDSITAANDCIARISGCETESEVATITRQVTQFFELSDFIFTCLHHSGGPEHYRYLVGCDPEWVCQYLQHKWFAVDPFISYALNNSNPILTTEIPLISPGQQRMVATANEYGLRWGIVVPAHSATWSGALFLLTGDVLSSVQRSFDLYRYLMRALALELLEWSDAKYRADLLARYLFDDLDANLLRLAQANKSTGDAAGELGISFSLARWRYEQLQQKFDVHSKRHAVEKAVALGIIPAKR